MLKSATSRKVPFWSQMLRNRFGQRRFNGFTTESTGEHRVFLVFFSVSFVISVVKFLSRFQESSPLKPLPRRRDGTDAAPAPPQKRNRHQHQDSPPGDPDEDDAEVAAADRRPEQTGQDCQQESRQSDDHDGELRPAVFQQGFDEGVAEDVHDQLPVISLQCPVWADERIGCLPVK